MRISTSLVLSLTLVACISESVPPADSPVGSSSSAQAQSEESLEVIAEGLQIPWGIAFLSSGDLLVTERPGSLLRIGTDRKHYAIDGVHHRGEGGLLGVVLHPDYESNHWIYLYMTTLLDGAVTNRIMRYTFENDELSGETEIISGLPGAANHDGGYMAFGPDGKLYVATGDASVSNNAQDLNSLAGKILRFNDDGSIPSDNPFGSAVYSYGHRNPQGLTWDPQGNLWSTEHGRSGATSGLDELNRIERGKNYGWPKIQGDQTDAVMVTPILHSGTDDTWAPASAEYYDGSIFFGGLRGEALYEVPVSGTPELITHYKNRFGRIRAVELGPDGYLYLTTSNTDGRGNPKIGDDKIIKVKPDRPQS